MNRLILRSLLKPFRGVVPGGAASFVSDEASESGPGAPGRTVTREEINRLPLHRYKGPIHLVGDDAAMDRAARDLRREKLVGFDTETRPAFKKGESYLPSVVQLAGAKAVYVILLASIGRKQKLFNLLANEKILKVGVALSYDIRKLKEVHAFIPGGFVELEALTDEQGIMNNGLRSLAAAVLGFRISKGAQRSNWGRHPLTPKQISYAATDAWVSREIYLAIQDRRSTPAGT